MGYLLDGEWKEQAVNPETKDGEFHRQVQKFRDEINEKGSFPPEKNRYHLYVSLACPWAHRALIMRKLKGLEEMIDVSVVSPDMLKDGWSFEKNHEGSTGDRLYDKEFLRDIYTIADPKFTGRVTVPVLFDKNTKRIVNNESSEVIRIFNSAFNELSGNHSDFYPKELQSEIDEINEYIYENINNGVYKTGFARNQKAYEHNFCSLFSALDKIEERLEGQDYLVGGKLTEADIRLWTTLIRFDAVYFTHFKCNQKMIKDYQNLSRFTRKLYQHEAFQSTTDFAQIKRHYYYSHETLNPFRIVPIGPDLDPIIFTN